MPAHIEKSASRYILVSLAVLLFITAMILVILQSSYFRNLQVGAFKTYADGYADGFTKARALAYASGFPRSEARTSLSGSVKSVGSSDVTFEITGLILDEAVDDAGLTRTAYATKDTKITLLQRLSPDEISRKQNEYAAKLSKLKPSDPVPAPPATYTESAIALSDIKPNDAITVMSVNNQDLLPLDTFYASKTSVTRP